MPEGKSVARQDRSIAFLLLLAERAFGPRLRPIRPFDINNVARSSTASPREARARRASASKMLSSPKNAAQRNRQPWLESIEPGAARAEAAIRRFQRGPSVADAFVFLFVLALPLQ
jgi:hypothetical protein